MRWSLSYGDDYRTLLEAGHTIPPAYEPPELLDGFGGWYEDFWELSTDRQLGNCLGPIPAASIDRHVAGWNYVDADMFRSIIRAMDGAYLEWSGKPSAEPAEPTSARDAFRGAFAAKRRG